MADRDISADESVLLHGADQRLYDLFCTARLAFKGNLSLVAAAADAPDAESLGEHTRQTVDASVLDQVVDVYKRQKVSSSDCPVKGTNANYTLMTY